MIRIKMYEDKEVQNKVLSVIPLEKLEAEARSKCRKDDSNNKNLLDYKDELVKSLLNWFKNNFFSWCDKPKCLKCLNLCTDYVETQSPTQEEKRWEASRTEVYRCNICNLNGRFPRYNNPIKLCETKTGRCGEWANLFGCILRSLNYETRFIDNFEDHVWNEYFSENLNRWIHVDSCENAWNTPLVYEQGWGRTMTFVLGYSIIGVQDCTSRYIKDFDTVAIRRNSETVKKLNILIVKNNSEMRKNLDQNVIKKLRNRDDDEVIQFGLEKYLSEEELINRQSGSEEWKKQRGEMK